MALAFTYAFPLRWPDGWPRTPPHARRDSQYQFRRSSTGGPWLYDDAAVALSKELEALGASQIVVTSDYQLRRDGQPIRKTEPEDPGLAVYFMLRHEPKVMASDMHARTIENMRSVTLAVDAMRQLERHGGGVMMQRAFSGFAALPPPTSWGETLGLDESAFVTVSMIEMAYRRRAAVAHPDRPGGSTEAMSKLNAARDAAFAALNGGRR